MPIINLDKGKYENVIKKGIVLVDYYADWCGPCKMLGPVLEQLAKERSDIQIVKVNIEKHENIVRKLSIMSVPTLILYKNGELQSIKQGFCTI